jgi:serine/threonine-protein kinase
MGEVYRAHDTKLGRDVALKILPNSFVHDPDRVTRFRREAQVLASLNHPHIAAIYGLEETNGSQFLILELVEGETLAQRLKAGPVPLEDALTIARQIADALEAAHEKGIIHRDLKPANIASTAEGQVKVLDFGLAKAVEAAPAGANVTHSPTLSMMATQAGVILGTAAYMSPEQAKGLAADHRSDVFSFGVVLYEMLTGRQPFQGDTAPDILASVLAREPDLGALPPNVNPRLTELLQRCLEKNPRRRWQAVGDLRADLDAIAWNARAPVVPPVGGQGPSRKALALGATLLVLATAAITSGAAWMLRRPPVPPSAAPITRFAIVPPDGQQFTNATRHVLALSPDGRKIVYVANRRLYLRSMGDLDARPIAGTETWGGVMEPVFSPDGLSIAFFASSDSTLKKISVNGGAAITLCAATFPFGMSWGADGIVFGQGAGGILRVSPNGGQPEVLVNVQHGEVAHGPQVLANGAVVLFTLATGSSEDRWDTGRIVAQSIRSGERRVVLSGGGDTRYLPTGHLVYAVGGIVFAVRFDLARLAVVGGATPVVEGVQRGPVPGVSPATAQFSVSPTGSLIYLPGPAQTAASQRVLAEVDRGTGHVVPLKLPPGSYLAPRYAPRSGTRVAFQVDEGKQQTIAICDVSGATTMRRLTLGGANRFPVWSADGQRITYQSDREGDLGIFWQRADGTGPVERLTKPEPGTGHVPDAWSPDGHTLLFEAVKEGRFSLWTRSATGQVEPFGTVQSSIAIDAAFSPDGHWVAYTRNAPGQDLRAARVYVEPFPRTGAIYPASNGMAFSPLWPPGSKALMYDALPDFFSLATFSTQPSVEFGNPAPVAKGGLWRSSFTQARPWDLSPDGTRILGVLEGTAPQQAANAPTTIQVVLNWSEELKVRVPAK